MYSTTHTAIRDLFSGCTGVLVMDSFSETFYGTDTIEPFVVTLYGDVLGIGRENAPPRTLIPLTAVKRMYPIRMRSIKALAVIELLGTSITGPEPKKYRTEISE